VKNPTEATLDSTVLRNVSSIGAQKARAMKLGSAAFDLDDFVSKLAIFMGGRHELADDASELDDIDDSVLDWEKVGRRALAKSRRVPVMGFMFVISRRARIFALNPLQAWTSFSRTEKARHCKTRQA